MVFGRNRHKREDQVRREEYERGIAVNTAGSRAQARIMSQAQMDRKLTSMQSSWILQEDEAVRELMIKNFPELIPLFSRLNSTSQLKKERDRKLIELKIKIILHEMKMELRRLGYADSWAYRALDSFEVFGIMRTFDTLDGYRGKLVTEEIENIRVRTEQEKKKGLLF